jgi:hypothetical protein
MQKEKQFNGKKTLNKKILLKRWNTAIRIFLIGKNRSLTSKVTLNLMNNKIM